MAASINRYDTRWQQVSGTVFIHGRPVNADIQLTASSVTVRVRVRSRGNLHPKEFSCRNNAL